MLGLERWEQKGICPAATTRSSACAKPKRPDGLMGSNGPNRVQKPPGLGETAPGRFFAEKEKKRVQSGRYLDDRILV